MNLSIKYLTIAVFLFGITACDQFNRRRTVVIKGSETLQPLIVTLAEKYNKTQSIETIFTIEGGGSQSGLEALLNSKADIAMSSKPFNISDFDSTLTKDKTIARVDIAIDELMLIVNSKNKVSKITVDELRKIYAGEILTWDKLGGKKDSILPLSRKEGSGSLSFFKEKAMSNQPFSPRVVALESVKEILAKVESDSNAIAFVGGGHFSNNIKVLDLSKDGVEYFYPSERNVKSNNYPFVISLSLYYVKNEENLLLSNFVKFCGSKGARYTIMDFGFVPVLNE